MRIIIVLTLLAIVVISGDAYARNCQTQCWTYGNQQQCNTYCF